MYLEQVTGPPLYLDDALARKGTFIAGAPGSGKTALVFRWLAHFRSKNLRFVIHDPAREFVTRFYRPGIDVVWNPYDARSPYWSLTGELRHDAEALAMATALIPAKTSGRDSEFFTEGPRKVLAALLSLKRSGAGFDWRAEPQFDRPTAADLVTWLADEKTLTALLGDDPGLRNIIHPGAPPQAAGVMAALTLVAESLKVLPAADECQGGHFTVREWVERTDGSCLFLTSTPETRDRLAPLQTLLLDLVILRLMQGPITQPLVSVVLEELAALAPIPTLYTAAQEFRKYNRGLMILVQDPMQLEPKYGRHWTTLVSTAATHIIFRLRDEKSATWASKTMGEVEVQRLDQSRKDNWGFSWDSTSRALRWHQESVLLPSQISGLPDLEGFVKVDNAIVKIAFPYGSWPMTQPDLVPRPIGLRRTATPRRQPAAASREARAAVPHVE